MYDEMPQDEIDNIQAICARYDITNYVINTDGSIDVDGNVNLTFREISFFELRFGNVSGDFDCSNNILTTLYGSPEVIGGRFICASNQLTSMEHCPYVIGGTLNCSYNNLTSLEGLPRVIRGTLNCSYNNLVSLQGASEVVTNIFNCSYNELTSLYNSPIEVGGFFICSYNPLTTLIGSPVSVGSDIECTYDFMPVAFFNATQVMVQDQIKIFFKYHSYYDVWTPEFNLIGMNKLISKINNGLR
jgi:hypothetical protein